MNWSKIRIRIFNLSTWILGKKISKNLLTIKYINFYRSQELIFIHIPKAAGTSVTNLIYGKRNGHLSAKTIRDFLGTDIFNNKKTFTVTRNPYDRILSAYMYARQGGSSEGGVSNPALYKGHAFRSFDSFVKEWLVKQNISKIDPIFRPQYEYVYDNNVSLVKHIFKVENLNELKEFLEKNLKKKIEIPETNRSRRSKEFKEYYSFDTINIISKLYSLDFELLQYELME